ncbi:MAG: ANTAR domain-containing protein [Bryobacterales bacterium]|nr:ANTAR domain-containing protein [Bryobacterales bacterium]MBV9399454.1 ANTAR domain-containing protein [Bryobacterales bacterium]
MRNWEAQPFRNSLSALASIAMRESGADGYAYFGPQRLDGGGVVIEENAIAGPSTGVRVYRLGEALLAFSFFSSARLQESAARLDRMVDTIRMVWTASESAEHYSDLIGRVNELETRLLDSKIADRARGFLSAASQSDLAGAISKHVGTILRPTETRRVLEKIVQDLEEEVEERRVAALAKGILQGAAGLTEEQAHAHLRALSRRSRKPLKDVALDLIQGRAR